MIALVFCGDLKYCPYITRYIERFDAANVAYRVYFWNRSGFELHLPENYVCDEAASDLNKGTFWKLLDFIRFRKWLNGRLDYDAPDKIVALSTLTGVLLGKRLYRKKNSYIFDIRDYSYEYIKLFYSIEKKVIKNSFFTAISSKGFQKFLPEHEYVIAHNFNREDMNGNYKFKQTDGKIHFVWNGVIRFFDYQRQYLDALKNDPRFEIVFHGDGPESAKYKKYCRAHGFNNVAFTGTYSNDNKGFLLENAQFLNNSYGYLYGAGDKLRYAVSNRFYDGMIYHIPQLVEPEGYKSEWTLNSGLGVNFSADSELADKLYEFYMSIDAACFDRACEQTLQSIVHDDNQFIEKIDAFIK